MKMFLAAAVLGLVAASPASAIELRTPIAKQLYTCAGSALSRVAFGTVPAPCCNGQLRCAQYLSTTGGIVPRQVPRT